MNGDNFDGLIQRQVFVFTDDVVGRNWVFQVYAVTFRALGKSVDIGGKTVVVQRAIIRWLENAAPWYSAPACFLRNDAPVPVTAA